MEPKQYVITKKISKQGMKNMIILPRLLKDELSVGTIVKVTIDVIKEPEVIEK